MSRASTTVHLATMVIRWASHAVRIAEKTVGPLLDVFIRLWLAGIFWASGMVKLQNWTIALYLSAHDYPVSWLDPVTAAWLGETIEIVCPPLLVFGLATRFAALPMLILSLVIQFSYQALDQHVFWAILFGWFVVKGAGPISLDALIGRGIAATGGHEDHGDPVDRANRGRRPHIPAPDRPRLLPDSAGPHCPLRAGRVVARQPRCQDAAAALPRA